MKTVLKVIAFCLAVALVLLGCCFAVKAQAPLPAGTPINSEVKFPVKYRGLNYTCSGRDIASLVTSMYGNLYYYTDTTKHYTVPDDAGYVVLSNNDTGNHFLVLPLATTCPGRIINISVQVNNAADWWLKDIYGNGMNISDAVPVNFPYIGSDMLQDAGLTGTHTELFQYVVNLTIVANPVVGVWTIVSLNGY